MDTEEKENCLPPTINVEKAEPPLTPISRILSSIRTPTYITNDSPQNPMSPASLCYQYKEANEQTGRELEVTKHHNEQLRKSLEDEQSLREENEKEVERLSVELRSKDRKLEIMDSLKIELATLRNENFELASVLSDRNRLQTQNMNLMEKCKDFNLIKNENVSLKKELSDEVVRREDSEQKVKYLVESKKESQNLEEEFAFLQEQIERYKLQTDNQIAELEHLKSGKENLEQEIRFLREEITLKELNKEPELPVYKADNLSVELEVQELKSIVKEMEQNWLDPDSTSNLQQKVEELKEKLVILEDNNTKINSELQVQKQLGEKQKQNVDEREKVDCLLKEKLLKEYSELENGLNQQLDCLLVEKKQLLQQLEDLRSLNEQLKLDCKLAMNEKNGLHYDWLKKEEKWISNEDKLKLEMEGTENLSKNLKNRLDHSENQVESLKENLKKTEEENRSFLVSISLIEKQTEELIKEKDAASFEIQSLEEKLLKADQEQIESENKIDSLTAKQIQLIEEIDNKKNVITGMKTKFENDLNSAEQEFKKLKNDNETLKASAKEIESKLRELELKNEVLISQHSEEIQSKNDAINILEKSVKGLENKENENKSAELKQDLKEVTEKLELLAENVAEMEAERLVIVKERDDLQTHVDNLASQLDNAHKIIEQKQSQSNKINELETKIIELNEEIEKLKNKENTESESEMRTKLEEKLNEHRKIVAELTETLKTSDQQMATLSKEKDDLKLKCLDGVEKLSVSEKLVSELQKKNKAGISSSQAQKKEIRDLQIRVSETNFAKYEAQNLAETLKNKLATLQKEADKLSSEPDRVWEIVRHREVEIKSLQEKHDKKVASLEERLKQRENEIESLRDFKASQQSIAFIDDSPVDSRVLCGSYVTPSKLKRSQSEDKLLTPTNQNQYFNQCRSVSQDYLNDSIECEKNAKKRILNLKMNLESTPSKSDQSRSCMMIESSLISKVVKDSFAFSTGDLSSTVNFPANITLDTSVARNRGHDTSVAQRRATMAASQVQWHGKRSKMEAMAPTQEEIDHLYYEAKISTLHSQMGASNFNPSRVGPSTSKITNIAPVFNPRMVEPMDSNPRMVMSSPLVDPSLRIAELQRRNLKNKAHLKSSYPIETQSLSFDHGILTKGKTPSKCDEAVRTGDPRQTLQRFASSSRTPHGVKRKCEKNGMEPALLGSKSRRETMSTFNLQATNGTFTSNYSASLNDIPKENEEPFRNPRRESTMFEIPNTPPTGKELRRSKRNKQPQDGSSSNKDAKNSSKLLAEKRTPSMLDRFRKPLRKKNAKK